MPKFAIPSAFDAAYWFLQYAEKNFLSFEDEKLHHLLFLAQIDFIQKHKNEILFPSMFIATKKGFLEPNILKIFANGHPFMPHIKVDKNIAVFLEQIADKYAKASLLDLRSSIIQSKAFLSCFDAENVMAFDITEIASLFTPKKEKSIPNRIRMSQNGPVTISKWQPRKLK